MSQLYTGRAVSEPDWGFASVGQKQENPDQAKDLPSPRIIDGEREKLPE